MMSTTFLDDLSFITNIVLNIKSVVEFGASLGCYSHYFVEKGINVNAYEGAKNINEITDGFVKHLDLTEASDGVEISDFVVCLEVGEHVPKQFEDNMFKIINNSNKKGVILSWAWSTRGEGHVNVHDNKYIKNKMRSYGYVNDMAGEKMLRDSATLSWFKKTLMVFKKAENVMGTTDASQID
eukprot:g272.t1